MRFWDSSAIVPLLVREAETPYFEKVYSSDAEMAVWWGTPVECVSALARYERDPRLAGTKVIDEGLRRLEDASVRWHEIGASMQVRDTAVALLRRHPLRAAGALQLAAATVAREDRIAGLDFVCADSVLIEAARKEGFNVIAPGAM